MKTQKKRTRRLFTTSCKKQYTVPAHDMLLVIGDLNARVGNDNTGSESNMGTQGCGIINDNGQRLCELCKENKLVIGDHFSWDGAITSQIDNVLVNKKWRSSLQHVRTRRGADVASDHNLVTGTVTLKLWKTKRVQERARQLDSKRLKNEVNCIPARTEKSI